MSGAAEANAPTAKAIDTNKSENPSTQHATPRTGVQLEEDDEFEDFPAEGALNGTHLTPTSPSHPALCQAHVRLTYWDCADTLFLFDLVLQIGLRKKR